MDMRCRQRELAYEELDLLAHRWYLAGALEGELRPCGVSIALLRSPMFFILFLLDRRLPSPDSRAILKTREK
jgi:hypothetical protein